MRNTSIEELNSIVVGMKTIKIETNEGSVFAFLLEYYTDFKSRKTIKKELTRLKELKNNA